MNHKAAKPFRVQVRRIPAVDELTVDVEAHSPGLAAKAAEIQCPGYRAVQVDETAILGRCAKCGGFIFRGDGDRSRGRGLVCDACL